MASQLEFPLVVIIGPTASGKTSIALDLAERHNGEIICADSRTIYRGMDIGTAKPTLEERQRVPHHLIDIVSPGEGFSVADFQQRAKKAISEIRQRGKVPFLVGGTGLYIDSILFDYQLGSEANKAYRDELAKMTTGQLLEYCINNNIQLPENSRNRRYLVRAIEQKGINTKRRVSIIDNCIVVGISTEKEELKKRIEKRIDSLFEKGVVEEATKLAEIYGWGSEAMTGNIYRVVSLMQKEGLSMSVAKAKCAIFDWRLAKRQLTWFKRNPAIVWLDLDSAVKYIDDYLDRGKHATIRNTRVIREQT